MQMDNMSDDVFAKVKAILAEALEQDELVLTPETKLDDTLGLDSFGIISLFMSVEGVFGVRFTMDDICRLTTVGGVVDGIVSRLPPSGDAHVS